MTALDHEPVAADPPDAAPPDWQVRLAERMLAELPRLREQLRRGPVADRRRAARLLATIWVAALNSRLRGGEVGPDEADEEFLAIGEALGLLGLLDSPELAAALDAAFTGTAPEWPEPKESEAAPERDDLLPPSPRRVLCCDPGSPGVGRPDLGVATEHPKGRGVGGEGSVSPFPTREGGRGVR